MNNLHIDKLVDFAFEIAKENFQDRQFSFAMIWSKTWKAAEEFKKEKVEDWIGDFYKELLLDPRFVCFGNSNWRLKDFLNYSEIKKLDKLIIFDAPLYDDDHDKASTKTSKKEAEAETEMVGVEDDSDVMKNLMESDL